MPQDPIDPEQLRQIVRQELPAAIRRELRGLLKMELGRLLQQQGRRELAGAGAGPGAVDPHLLAVLTAAAFAALRRPVRLRSVTFLNQNTVSGWVSVGRVAVQTSHNLMRRTAR